MSATSLSSDDSIRGEHESTAQPTAVKQRDSHDLTVGTDLSETWPAQVELTANPGNWTCQLPMTPAAARVLAINLMRAAETCEAHDRKRVNDALKLILQHLAEVCGHSEALFHWVTGWLAYPLQNPGAKLETCLQICGRHGTGKSVTAQLIAGLYGRDEVWHDDSGRDLKSAFNGWLLNRRLLVLDGDFDRSGATAELTRLLASKTLIIEQRGKQATEVANQLNLVLVSDELPDATERRRMVLTCQQHELEYFRKLVQAMEHGGQQAFKEWLLKLDITDFADGKGLLSLNEVQPCAA